VNISRQQVVGRLREANFTYVTRAKHTEMYRRRGGDDIVFVSRCDLFDENMVRVTLSQAGLTLEQINSFLSSSTKG
jgi:hypothetical protein